MFFAWLKREMTEAVFLAGQDERTDADCTYDCRF